MKTFQGISLVALVIVLVLAHSATASSSDHIQKACQPAIDKSVCIRTIKTIFNTANATNATIPDLANIVLKLASVKAVNATTHINTILRNASSLEPAVFQRINECSVHFQDAVDMVDNSVAAFSVKAYDDVTSFLNVAVADAKACEDEIKAVGPKELVRELSKLDRMFQRLCNIALVITKAAEASA